MKKSWLYWLWFFNLQCLSLIYLSISCLAVMSITADSEVDTAMGYVVTTLVIFVLFLLMYGGNVTAYNLGLNSGQPWKSQKLLKFLAVCLVFLLLLGSIRYVLDGSVTRNGIEINFAKPIILLLLGLPAFNAILGNVAGRIEAENKQETKEEQK